MKDVKILPSLIINEVNEERMKGVDSLNTLQSVVLSEADMEEELAWSEREVSSLNTDQIETYIQQRTRKYTRKRAAAPRDRQESGAHTKMLYDLCEEQDRTNVIALDDTGRGDRVIFPLYSAIHTYHKPVDQVAGGSNTAVRAQSVADVWTWVQGSGYHQFGAVLSMGHIWIEFGFWMLPLAGRFYNIIPHNTFKGEVMLKESEERVDQDYDRVSIDVWTNVWQQNWKGWKKQHIIGMGPDYENDRIDTERHTLYRVFLEEDNWVYVRHCVSLGVFSKGAGAYTEVNFSDGHRNFIACPHCHIINV